MQCFELSELWLGPHSNFNLLIKHLLKRHNYQLTLMKHELKSQLESVYEHKSLLIFFIKRNKL